MSCKLGVIQEDLGGVFDAIVHASLKINVPFKIIADISKDNLRIMEKLDRRISMDSES